MSYSDQIDDVRFLVGDTDPSEYELTNKNIMFALRQATGDAYIAAAICARSLGARYAKYADTKFEDVSVDYSQISENYYKTALRLEKDSKKYGKRGLGMPDAGGLTYTGIDLADDNPDRVKPKFRQDQFANPPRDERHEKYGW